MEFSIPSSTPLNQVLNDLKLAHQEFSSQKDSAAKMLKNVQKMAEEYKALAAKISEAKYKIYSVFCQKMRTQETLRLAEYAAFIEEEIEKFLEKAKKGGSS